MRTPFTSFSLPRFSVVRWFAAVLMISASLALAAQGPDENSVENQRAAMHRLAFLAGHWSGPVTVVRGPGEPLSLTQTENVEYKLDGLVMLLEGQSTGADGKPQFQALATIAYDDATHTYRFRAYHGGHYLDTKLNVFADGFSWGFAAGPAQVTNTMHLTAQGKWQETTEVAMGGNPPRPSVKMLLARQP